MRFAEDKYRGAENLRDSLLRLFFLFHLRQLQKVFFLSGFETDGAFAEEEECRDIFFSKTIGFECVKHTALTERASGFTS